MINDLIGLDYERRARPADGHGKTDCFMLCCEVRRRLGLHDYEQDFSWAYDDYDAGNLPIKTIMRWLFVHGEKTMQWEDGNITITKAPSGELGVGTVYDGGMIMIARGCRSFWYRNLPDIRLFKMRADV